MRITVTAKDIARGWPLWGDGCPLARAIRRHRGWEDAYVGDEEVWQTLPGAVSEGVPLPPQAVQFRRRFDRQRGGKPPFRPFSFTLRVPRGKP